MSYISPPYKLNWESQGVYFWLLFQLYNEVTPLLPQFFFIHTLCVKLSGEGWIRTNYLIVQELILTEVTLFFTIISEEIRKSVLNFFPVLFRFNR